MITVVSALLQRLIEIFVVILIAIHIPTIIFMIPPDNSFVVGIAAVSVFIGIVRVFAVGIATFFVFVGIVVVFRAGLGVGTAAEFACL